MLTILFTLSTAQSRRVHGQRQDRELLLDIKPYLAMFHVNHLQIKEDHGWKDEGIWVVDELVSAFLRV